MLECNGNYHIADLVTKIIRGVFSSLYRHLFRLSKEKWLSNSLLGSLTELDNSNELTLEPEELFFTSSGRIGVIVDAPKTSASYRVATKHGRFHSKRGWYQSYSVRCRFFLREKENMAVIHVDFTDSEHQKAPEVALMPIRHLLASSMATFLNDCSPFWTFPRHSTRFGKARVSQRGFQHRSMKYGDY